MGMALTDEIALTYFKDSEPQFTLSIFRPQEVFKDGEEQIEVRGQQGTKMDMEYFRILHWDEGGLRYNVFFENPELTFEEVLQLTEQMELVK